MELIDVDININRLNSMFENSKRPVNKWSANDDRKLQEAVLQFGPKNWKMCAQHVETKSPVQCHQRWSKVLNPGQVKGTWKPEEDKLLICLVLEGHKNWGKIAAKMPGRSSRQCRDRWVYSLDPSVNHDPFTKEEDDILLRTHKEIGNKWADISLRLPGRTEGSVKSRFRSLMRCLQQGKPNNLYFHFINIIFKFIGKSIDEIKYRKRKRGLDNILS